ncbi:MAG: hypothetical protein ABR569_03785 [Gaiellaceae bacterium]
MFDPGDASEPARPERSGEAPTWALTPARRVPEEASVEAPDAGRALVAAAIAASRTGATPDGPAREAAGSDGPAREAVWLRARRGVREPVLARFALREPGHGGRSPELEYLRDEPVEPAPALAVRRLGDLRPT